jgi:hypothetical protein
MRYIKSLILFTSLYFISLLFLPGYSYACCSNADCGGTTCANPPAICPPGGGTCTGGGTECGFGVGSACPSGYTCTNGTCVGSTGCTTNSQCGGTNVCCNGTCVGAGQCGGGGGGSCPWSPVNCPANTTVDYSQLVSTGCYQPTGCGAAGSAQTYPFSDDNCCGYRNGDCVRWNLNTYACVAINYNPIGNHDASTCSSTTGWACDQNNYLAPLNVHLYLDGAAGAGGTYLTSLTANQTREAAVGALCGGYANHGFTYNTPTSLIDGIAHTIYAYAINTPTGNNPLLPSIQRTFTCTPTCTVDLLPVSSSIAPGATTSLTATITASSGTITQVNFGSSNTSIASVSAPGYDNTSSYTTSVTANSVGTATITANVVMSGAVRCTDTASVTAINTVAWWQAKDGDITAENGGILSTVPAAAYFDTDGTGGFPGVPTYYNGSLNYGSGLLSTKQWSANTLTSQSRRFDYSYFNNLIPSDFVSPTTYDGYVWTKISGAHTLSATDFTTNKNVLFVNGDLNITGNITLTDGTGFFLAIVSGNITVDPSVTSLEGIYLTDGTFSTGAGTSALNVRGSVASYTGFTASNLQRNLANNNQPAELFTFAPDQIALFPEKLGFRRTRWTEVAP